MAAFAAAGLSSALPLLLCASSSTAHLNRSKFPCLSFSFTLSPPRATVSSANPRHGRRTGTIASSNSASPFDEFGFNETSRSNDKKSLLSDLIQEIEPLDVSLIQKDVPPTTLDAMKRTISGMLGLLPSDRFQVFIEALWEPLSKLLVSSMMTGNLDMHEEDLEKEGIGNDFEKTNHSLGKHGRFENTSEEPSDSIDIQGLGEMSPEAQQYILHLQTRLSSVKKELNEVQRKSAALQMQQFVGEEKNDLLDYLRSLQPEKVAELSEPTTPELKETIHSVVHGLLATLSPKMHSKAPPQSENTSTGSLNIGGEDCAELVENTSLHFQPLLSLTRDYLARLLFWCMLLGHYLRGLEYRMKLTELLSFTSLTESDACADDEQVA